MMNEPFTRNKEDILRGSLGALKAAVELLDSCLESGECPLTKSRLMDVAKLADGAAVMVSQVKYRK